MTGALLDALAPLGDALADADGIERLLATYGWRADVDPANVGAIGTALGLSLLNQATALASQIESSAVNPAALVQQLLSAVPGIVADLEKLSSGANPLSFAPFSTAGFWAQFVPDLVNGLIADWLERRQPVLHAVATLLGLITRTPVLAQDAGRLSYTQTVINWDQLGTAVVNPGRQLATTYHWGDTVVPFDHDTLLRALERVLLALGVPARREPVRPDLASSYFPGGAVPAGLRQLTVPLMVGTPSDFSGFLDIGVIILPVPPTTNRSAAPDGLLAYPVARGYGDVAISVGAPFTLELAGGLDADGAVTTEVHPGSATVTTHLPGPLSAQASLVATPTTPWIPLGTPGDIHLEVPGLLASVAVQGAITDPEVLLTVATGPGSTPPHVALVLAFTDGDGFLQSIFGTTPQRLEFGLKGTWSSKTGLSLQTSAGLKLVFPINQTFAAVTVQAITVQLAASGGGAGLLFGLSAAAAIGPVHVSANGVGAQLDLISRPPGAPPQAFGDLGISFGFAGPTALGLSVDADPISGGGFVSFDQQHSQYAGVLELALESLSLTAIGLIQTKMADGTPLPGGFSLLVVISVEFVPFVELGFGFSLNGVGGYLGLNRTINADALRAGVHSGLLNDIMFPVDPVGHAPQLIQELAGFFPAAPGRFLIGPMVQIQWGSPLPILTADLGVIVELPAPVRIAILGVLQLGLPQAGEDAVILLNLDVLGLVDFGLGTLSLDASLYGSRIAEFPVTGDMALRLGWKAEREFIASFGGCHPAQQLPPNFPALNRLAICLSNSDKLVFTLQAYLAATSNTLQFGASAHLLADVGEARVDGMMSFDALIHTNPFGLEVDFAAAVTVWFDGQQLLAVNITGQLTGPAPWQISAQATISLFGFSTTVSFTQQLGAAAALLLPAPVFVAGLLADAVGKSVNWSALPPPGDTVVTLTPAPPSGTDMRAHPLGSLTFHQNTAPLGISIDKFGSADVSGPTKLALTSISYGDSTVDPAVVTPVQAAFAPGQFLRLSDGDALSLPAFATYQAGVTFTPTAPDLDDFATGDAAALSYTIDLIDSHGQLPASPPPPLDAQAASRVVPSGPAARAPTRTTGPCRYQGTPGTIAVNPRAPAGREAL